MGGNMPCTLNAANEIAVDAFLHGRIRFVEMPELVAETMACIPFVAVPSYADIIRTNEEARLKAKEILCRIAH